MIVLDMEWNQPLSMDSPLAIRLCTLLPFEIIQIGAVRLEDGAQFKATCCLQQYKVLSPRISKLTGITKQDVKKRRTLSGRHGALSGVLRRGSHSAHLGL